MISDGSRARASVDRPSPSNNGISPNTSPASTSATTDSRPSTDLFAKSDSTRHDDEHSVGFVALREQHVASSRVRSVHHRRGRAFSASALHFLSLFSSLSAPPTLIRRIRIILQNVKRAADASAGPVSLFTYPLYFLRRSGFPFHPLSGFLVLLLLRLFFRLRVTTKVSFQNPWALCLPGLAASVCVTARLTELLNSAAV